MDYDKIYTQDNCLTAINWLNKQGNKTFGTKKTSLYLTVHDFKIENHAHNIHDILVILRRKLAQFPQYLERCYSISPIGSIKIYITEEVQNSLFSHSTEIFYK